MTSINPQPVVSLEELKSRCHDKTIALESAINNEKTQEEINHLYQELKIIQQQLNLAHLEEELKKTSAG
jgi:hypothetical protein